MYAFLYTTENPGRLALLYFKRILNTFNSITIKDKIYFIPIAIFMNIFVLQNIVTIDIIHEKTESILSQMNDIYIVIFFVTN